MTTGKHYWRLYMSTIHFAENEIFLRYWYFEAAFQRFCERSATNISKFLKFTIKILDYCAEFVSSSGCI